MREFAPSARVLIRLTIAALAMGAVGPYAFGQAAPSQKKPSANPELGISPKKLQFPAQEVATSSAPQTVILTNNTKDKLTVDSVVASGEFRLKAPAFPQILNPGGSTAAVVTFNPKQEGIASGALTILSSPDRKVWKAWTVPLSGKATNFWGCPDRVCADLILAIVLCIFYWLAMVIVRWHRVAQPTRELLRAQIWSLQTELDTLPANPPADSNGTRSENLKGLLQKADDLIDKNKTSIADYLFWSRGQEITGWGYVHEVEVQMIPLLPVHTVTARLETSEQRLRGMKDPPLELANLVKEELAKEPGELERRKALLTQALYAIYDCVDTGFASLVSWQNKTSWLVGCGLVLIIALTGVIPDHGILFLLGGTGGLLSRMSRSLDRKDVPTDYGASWTTLFLSPVAGALGAWTGILLSNILVKAQVLGDIFSADWDYPSSAKTLAIALVFGFSERLLDSVLDKLIGNAATDKTTTAAPKPAPPAPAPAPQGGSKLAIASAPKLADGKVGEEYSAKLEAAGAAGTPKWSSATGSTPPAGLNLGEDGTITGTPTAPGDTTFTIEVKDQQSTVSQVFKITIKP